MERGGGGGGGGGEGGGGGGAVTVRYINSTNAVTVELGKNMKRPKLFPLG